MKLGGIEAGGTKMVCAIGDETGQIFDKITIPTETPDITVTSMIEYFRKNQIDALGIGCFGPLDLIPSSDTYGYITKTPKAAWADYNILGAFKNALSIPIGFDTDVNGAILGEVSFGCAKNCSSAIYITIGTGIGVGVYVNGGLLHGLVHPEGGHILLTPHPKDTYTGKCQFHSNCFEGLASGPAIEDRWHKKAEDLVDSSFVWELEAYYISQAIATYILTYSPEKIVLWGGVMHQTQLYPLIWKQVPELLNGYVQNEMITNHINEYIVPPALGDEPGIKGALALAFRALSDSRL